MGYDVLLFCEIIESIQGIIHLRDGEKDGIKIRFYQGLKGTLVMVDITDEYLPTSLAKVYMEQLGLRELISSLFPNKAVTHGVPLIEQKIGNVHDCGVCNGVGKVKLGEDIIACHECEGTGTQVPKI